MMRNDRRICLFCGEPFDGPPQKKFCKTDHKRSFRRREKRRREREVRLYDNLQAVEKHLSGVLDFPDLKGRVMELERLRERDLVYYRARLSNGRTEEVLACRAAVESLIESERRGSRHAKRKCTMLPEPETNFAPKSRSKVLDKTRKAEPPMRPVLVPEREAIIARLTVYSNDSPRELMETVCLTCCRFETDCKTFHSQPDDTKGDSILV